MGGRFERSWQLVVLPVKHCISQKNRPSVVWGTAVGTAEESWKDESVLARQLLVYYTCGLQSVANSDAQPCPFPIIASGGPLC